MNATRPRQGRDGAAVVAASCAPALDPIRRGSGATSHSAADGAYARQLHGATRVGPVTASVPPAAVTGPCSPGRYTLIINRFDSRCGHCGENTLPTEKQHLMVPSLGEAQSGCRVRWVFVDTDYPGIRDDVAAMRPDLTPAWEVHG